MFKANIKPMCVKELFTFKSVKGYPIPNKYKDMHIDMFMGNRNQNSRKCENRGCDI